MVTQLASFLSENSNIVFPHRHDFYQLLYITEGSGRHIIDFEAYPVEEGYIYFLSPGMMHTWDFEGYTEGYIINFQGSFFQSFFQNESILMEFPFFHSLNNAPLLHLDGELKQNVKRALETILEEHQSRKPFFEMAVRSKMVELFVVLSRAYTPKILENTSHNNITIVRDFEKLVEKHFIEKRFPKDYSVFLGITPNYLNEVCMGTVGKSAGLIIRERVILESKRLLVHSKSSVSEIAYHLNFADNAYFSRFFKKYTDLTPEVFRQQNSRFKQNP